MPDTRVCPVCLGLPGALPRVSRGYVELGAVAGIALGCSIANYTKFDRKHYFYPDLAKGYQITQYDLPLCKDGFVEVDGKKIRIERIHLEEDAGKSLHLQGNNSYIDYNRCGTPLIEIVTKPDLTSGEDAAAFMQNVQEILRYVGVTAGNLEEGNMRCDVNINLAINDSAHPAKEWRTHISEIKNLNSFKSIRGACSYETRRQLAEFEALDETEKDAFAAAKFHAGMKRTVGWDDEKGETVLQRTKNSFVDYRFVVEPDIKPFFVSSNFIENAKKKVGELPQEKRARFKKDYGLTDFDAQTLTSSRALSLWFEKAAHASRDPKRCANWIIAEVLALLNERNITIDEVEEVIHLTPLHIAQLADAVSDGAITSKQAKEVFSEMTHNGKMPEVIIAEKGMAQVSDSSAIEQFVDEVIAENPGAIAEYKNGKTNVLGGLMGQVMKKSSGKANPAEGTKILKQKLAAK